MRLLFISALLLASYMTVAMAAPATGPATQPTLGQLRQRVLDADRVLANAKAAYASSLESSPEYRAAMADVAKKEKVLAEARARGTPQQRIAASADFNASRSSAERVASKLETGIRAAMVEQVRAKEALTAAEAEEQRQIAAAPNAAPVPQVRDITKPEIKYDKFRDETRVCTQILHIKTSKGITALDVLVGRTYPGKNLREAGVFDVVFEARTATAPYRDLREGLQLIILADEKRLSLPIKDYWIKAFDGFEGRTYYTEGLVFHVDGQKLKELLGAEKVEGQIAITEFVLSKEQLEAIRAAIDVREFPTP